MNYINNIDMKQIYILLIAMCAIAFTACSKDDDKNPIDDDNGGEEMITAVYEPEYEWDLDLNIGTFKEGENITIAWGDGGVSEFKSFADTDSWGWDRDEELHYAIGQGVVEHKYPNYNSHTIKIKGKIKEFYCYDVLTKLDVSKCPALVNLYCGDNNISSLDVSKCTALTKLECYANNLTSLDISKNTALTHLRCSTNYISSLDVSKCTALTYLECHENKLTSLGIGKNTALTNLYCDDNYISSLDVSKCTALTELDCGGNNLTSLDVSKNTALTKLWCYHNNLTSLDVTNNIILIDLSCGNNNLTSLDVSKNTALTYLHCENNNLSASALNKIFNDLPQGKKWNEYGQKKQSTISIGNNPGTNTCDKSIAENKGWIVW